MIITDLDFSYSDLQVFSKFNFSSDSKLIILKGPSGCGKTTLLKLLTKDISEHKCYIYPEFKKKCLIIQEDALIPWLTGIKNLSKFLHIKEENIIKHPLFSIVKDYINKIAANMSYGQRRILELFRAILYEPDLLCLDEPFNFIDPDRRRIISKILDPDNNYLNNTQVIITTHLLDEVLDQKADTFYFDGKFPINSLSRSTIFVQY